jgi:hypothetical protein
MIPKGHASLFQRPPCPPCPRWFSCALKVAYYLLFSMVAIRHDLGTNLAAALNEPHDGDFVFVQDSAQTLPFALVHISGFAADVGLRLLPSRRHLRPA